jgi:hypothetical protein
MTTAYRRFQDSKVMTYERWHDGLGYDLEALAEMTDAERKSVESELIRNTTNWRDIEALAALGTDTAKAHIRKQIEQGSSEVRLAAARALAGDKESDRAREDAIIHALKTAEPMNGLARALDMAAEHKSPRIIEALLRCTLRPVPEVAVNAAGLVYYLFGKTSEPFDWDKRPFFLRFGEGGAEQRKAFTDMCAELGVDAQPYLKSPG